MRISIFGLGYVGCVSLGCFAQKGYNVIGIDLNNTKVNLINQGKPTIIEKDIDIIIEQQFKKKRIRATKDFKKAVIDSDISIICVGTPSKPEGHLNLDYIFNSAQQIGEAIKDKKSYHIAVIRSTVIPGTNQKVGEIIEKASGKKRNKDFAVVSNPEFLREGSAVKDFYNPAYIVLGSDNEFAIEQMKILYNSINAPLKIVDIKVAELIKYVSNSFHALKIVFANEVGNICHKLNIDSHELMNLFADDNKLNISKVYLNPGFAYGGSCLPKDLKGLNTIAHDHYIKSPVLNAIETSNSYQKEIVLSKILDMGYQNIGIVGLSFKPGTDDLRNSPIVDIIEKLLGKGKNIRIYDKNVQLAKLVGKNKSYIMKKLPHLSRLMVYSFDKLIRYSELIIVNNNEKELENSIIPADKTVYDLCRIPFLSNHPKYFGISW